MAILGCLTVGANPSNAAPIKHTPEEEILLISARLKPISDDTWKTVAGTRISEKYEIAKGDTLWDISKKLFGDAHYWPKIWALNNGAITNPHWIKPGNFVAFLPGTGSSLPAIAINGVAVADNDTSGGSDAGGPGATLTDATSNSGNSGRVRSQDWRYLPPQSWENINIALPPDVDPLGFDLKNKNRILVTNGLDLEAIAATDRIPFLGEITGANVEAKYLGIGDLVYVTGEENLQVGTVYAVTTEPNTLQTSGSDRSGYAYQILGKVKITGVRDNLFTATVLTNFHYMPRKSRLITLPAKIKGVKPIPGPSGIEAVLMLDSDISTQRTTQHSLVFVDRGTEDGVAPGMVFRAYQHYDPNTDKKVTDADIVSEADIMVLQVSQRFSAAMVIRGDTVLLENARLVLLTDVSDLAKRKHSFSKNMDAKKPGHNELDDLDKLDGGGVGKEEEKELKQLEKWKGNDSSGDKSGAPDATGNAPPSADELSPVPPVNGDEHQPSRDKVAPPPPPALDTEPQAPNPDSFPATESPPTAPPPPASLNEVPAPPPPPPLDDSKSIENSLSN